jgi:hypothetical protein
MDLPIPLPAPVTTTTQPRNPFAEESDVANEDIGKLRSQSFHWSDESPKSRSCQSFLLSSLFRFFFSINMARKFFSYEALTKVVQLASSTFRSRRTPTKDELFVLRSEVGKLNLHDIDENLPHLIGYLHPRADNERTDVFCSLLISNEDFDVAIFILPKGNPLLVVVVFFMVLFFFSSFTYPVFPSQLFTFTGSRLPLHDHPHMTVVSKLLVGSVHWLGFDWCPHSSSPSSAPSSSSSPLPKAYKAIDGQLSAREGEMAQVLLPREGGNLHEIHALEPTVLFDLLAPPYGEDKPDEKEGEEEGRDGGVRHCTYYEVEGEGEVEREGEKKVFTLRPLQSSSVYQNFSISTYSPQVLQDYIQQACQPLS